MGAMDLVLTGGTVRSGHDGWRPHAGLSIRRGRVAALGAPVRRCGRVLDLQGGCALPGLADAHLHLLGHALVQDRIDLRAAPSLGAVLEAVRRRAAEQPEGWILGRGWDEERWPERRPPLREDLDAAAPGRAVVLSRVCGHVVAASSRALEHAGVGPATADPAGGLIDRDASGRPTGIVREAAVDLVLAAAPAPPPARLRGALSRALRECLACGLTQVQTDDVASARGLDAALRLYRSAGGPDGVPVRVTLMIPAGCVEEAAERGIATGWGDRWLRAGHAKLFADGSLGARTAALREPYADDPATSGVLVHDLGELTELVARAHRRGFQVGIHAIGDAAAHLALAAVARAQRTAPRADARPRLIHCQVTGRDTFAALRRAGAVADIQPVFVRSDALWVERRIGPERASTSYAWRTIVAAGIPACGGSDCPIEPLDPLLGLAAAVTRRPAGGGPPWRPEERLSVAQALDLVTRGAAYATYEEAWRGSLAPGYAGDVTVLDRDPFRVDPDELETLRVLATVVGGRVAYEA
jgi:predicted amidohydrolase YtcJ